jgi:cell division protein FtsQ
MTRAAPGGALREGRSGPRSTLSTAGASSAPPEAVPGREETGDSVVGAVPLRVRRRGRAGRVFVVGLAGAGVAAWLLLASPFTTLTAVDVEGASSRWAEQVRLAAEQELGTPLARIDAGAVAERVQAVPGVLRASVRTRWPHGLVVNLVERTPAVGVRVPAGVRVFDASGVDLGVKLVARGLPLVTVPGKVRGATAAAALRVRNSLPPSLREQIVELGATSPDGVWFVLRGGTRVTWGSADAPAEKAAALAVMRSIAPSGRARTVDVSAPDAPAVS